MDWKTPSVVTSNPLSGFWQHLPVRLGDALYRFGLERGGLDVALSEYVAQPFLRVFRMFDRWERRWTDFLSGGQSRKSDRVQPSTHVLEELL